VKILFAFPPNFTTLNRAFKLNGRPAIFSWGDTIYNPYRCMITPELMAHEEVHGERQEAAGPLQDTDGRCIYNWGPERWWEKYIREIAFRLNEEILAHRAEFATFCRNHPCLHDQAKALKQIAGRLSGPLYGQIISTQEAMARINA
jgi:hypothetical protein